MIYGGNYGRTTYGGVSGASQIVKIIFKKGIAVLRTVTEKVILLTRTRKITLTTVEKDKIII